MKESMKELERILKELGISKVKFAKYLGVSRQMVYNYLKMESINDWPKEKKIRLFKLLDINSIEEIKNISIDYDYIKAIDERLAQGMKITTLNAKSEFTDLPVEYQELISDIIYTIKSSINKDTYITFKQLHEIIQNINNSHEIKYILEYLSKAFGYTDPKIFSFNEHNQVVLESILYSGFSLYKSGRYSRTKILETHEKFVQDLKRVKEEQMNRTQELNLIKIQALKELGYTALTEENAREVFAKMAEIQSRTI